MRDCHLCPVSKLVQAGKFKDRPWKDTPCAACYEGRVPTSCQGCPTRALINAGKLVGVPFEDTPCARCRRFYEHDPLSHHGRSHVEFDPQQHDAMVEQVQQAIKHDSHPVFAADPEHHEGKDLSMAAMSYVAGAILSLDPVTREIVLDKLANPHSTLNATARRLHRGKSTIHERLQKARSEWPALAYALPPQSKGSGVRKTKNEQEKQP